MRFRKVLKRYREPGPPSVVEGYSDLPLLPPDDMAAPGNTVRRHSENKAFREPERAFQQNAGTGRGNIANDTIDRGRAEQNLSGLQNTASLGRTFLLHGGW